jgi:hypothetical protein
MCIDYIDDKMFRAFIDSINNQKSMKRLYSCMWNEKIKCTRDYFCEGCPNLTEEGKRVLGINSSSKTV